MRWQLHLLAVKPLGSPPNMHFKERRAYAICVSIVMISREPVLKAAQITAVRAREIMNNYLWGLRSDH